MRKIVAINGSPRKDGCCAKVMEKVAETAKAKGFKAEIINVAALNIKGCKACMACKKTGECAQRDDMTALYQKLRDADMLLLATPIYFAAETAQLKCFIDRLYAMIPIVDGEMRPDMGKKKVASVFIPCGAPNGAMAYGGVLTRLTSTLKSFGIDNISGAIVPGAKPDTVLGTDYVEGYLEAVESQLAEL
ncbi:MAG: flavodoxin family protein [Thermoplasmatales archaeon]|nr:flavodoxin family protein [Thermoplasmatales archaeon]